MAEYYQKQPRIAMVEYYQKQPRIAMVILGNIFKNNLSPPTSSLKIIN